MALKKPTAVLKLSGDQGCWTEEQVRGMICNPTVAGVGPFPQIVDDEKWVKAACQQIKQEGPEQFLVNLLHVLRQTFDCVECTPKE